MALDRLTQITSSGITSTVSFRSSGINVTGVVTATSFVGDGSGLTGVVGSGSGVVILDDNATVGTASTINFGSNLSVSPISAGIVTVTGTDTNTTYSQAAVADGSNVNLRLSGSDSTTDDILLTAGSNITFSSVTAGGFTISASGGGGGGGETLDQTLALGNSSSRGMSVGVLTATSLIKSGGTSSQFLKADGSVDSSTYLTTTGSGSGLSNVVNSITAGSGISVNQSTGSVTITGSGTTAIINSDTLNVLGVSTFAGVTTHTASLFGTQASFTGVVTASQFRGDGSLLTGVIGQGSGITVKDDATTVGVAGTIDFGTGLTVSTLSAGIVTVTGTTGTNYWNSTSVGLGTVSSVGIGTTNPTEKLTVYGTSGVLRALVHNTGTTGASDFVAYDLKAGSTPNHWSIYTNSVTNYFRIFDNSKGASGLRFIIDDSGNIGLGGNVSPTRTLDVTGNAAISSNLNVTGVTTIGTVQVSSGVVTATSGTVTYYGDATNTATRFVVTNSGFSDWVFTAGVGITAGITNDPILYLARGQVYEFQNNGSSSHPFRIYTDSTGATAYTPGTTKNDGTAHSGAVLRFEIPMNAPNTLYYRCQNHSGMGNTISIYPNTI